MTLLKFKAKPSKKVSLQFKSLEGTQELARQARRARAERIADAQQSLFGLRKDKAESVRSFEEWLHTPLPADHYKELEDELQRIKEKWAKKYFFNF